jgi:hypothetical protein
VVEAAALFSAIPKAENREAGSRAVSRFGAVANKYTYILVTTITKTVFGRFMFMDLKPKG